MPGRGRLLHLRLSAEDVPERVLLTGDPGRVDLLSQLLEDPSPVAHNREFKSVIGEYGGEEVLVCSTGIGAPSAAIAVNELLEAGAEAFVRVGTTGALQRGIEVGSVVVPHGAVRMEGTSDFYASPEYPAIPDLRMTLSLAREARLSGLSVYEGIVATMDAFYVEEDWLLEEAGELNLVAVEMECSVLFVLSRLAGARSAAILVVDGNLAEGSGKADVRLEESEIPTEAGESLLRAAEVALRVLTSR